MMNTEKKKPTEELDTAECEITDEELGEVTGGVNPFENIPRVPTKPIDDNLRENG